ncbi:hypothetical protein [Algibacter lectus]|uniref:Pentapeptide repeat-containing protein n=1 Tax=Algibacter lectus TaxID=221126 RepID=A0A090VJT1_9FLAO|nr:hypothetical protein [Algibacter lectus]GAL63604.1 hypothetical protein JCM19300_1953 [Algibacter lectus]
MERRVAKNIDELFDYWKTDIVTETIKLADGFSEEMSHDNGFVNIDVDFNLNLPFSSGFSNNMIDELRQNSLKLCFKNCVFLKDVYIGKMNIDLEFIENCKFNTSLKSNGNLNNLTFANCLIRDINFEDANFGGEEVKNDQKGKVRFRNCDIFNTNFRNTTFNSITDFWSSTFHKPVTFYKTDFRDVVVFSAVNFKENVLFTYTLIEKLMILRGAYPEKGFDLSLAIISGKLSVFDLKFDDYNSYSKIYKDLDKELTDNVSFQRAYEIVYEKAVSKNHNIPIENKRETYRILKNQLESQKNYIDSIPFRVMENKTLLKESYIKLVNGNNVTRSISDIIVLSLNAISNWFGSSYIIGLLFTVCIAGFFFSLSLNHIGNYVFSLTFSDWEWQYFVQFLNPTHRFDYMKLVDTNPRQWFFIWDFLGRIFVGYGIYQTITAFRKYK